MADGVLVDNDVIIKTCCYDVVDELIGCIAEKTRAIQALGVARYVAARAISKGKHILNKERATDRLARLLLSMSLIEPTGEELILAAEFEERAQSCGVDLDGGESQLLAILITRCAALLVTGDKRAIAAMGPVVQGSGYEERAARRVACLEQIVMALITRHGAETLRARVCSEPAVDISLAICFSCDSGSRPPESIVAGLLSYIIHLRRSAPFVLVDSDDLSTVIP